MTSEGFSNTRNFFKILKAVRMIIFFFIEGRTANRIIYEHVYLGVV